MSSGTRAAATLDDLYKIDGKAELIDGRIVRFMPTGFLPSHIAGEIFASLREYAQNANRGIACTDNLGFAVARLTSGRQSFSPDAAFYTGRLPANRMRFIQGPPTLAVEVRSEGDYGNAAEKEQATKRADYFEAGTLAVWDVDPEGEVIRCYRSDAPDQPREFRRGDFADAEPAVPGWRVAVDDVFG
jgi:Uma2 family endonuclease